MATKAVRQAARDLRGQLRKRDLFGDGRTDWVCKACVTIVPDPDKGCSNCQRVESSEAAKLEAFKQSKRKEEQYA